MNQTTPQRENTQNQPNTWRAQNLSAGYERIGNGSRSDYGNWATTQPEQNTQRATGNTGPHESNVPGVNGLHWKDTRGAGRQINRPAECST